MLCFSAIIPRDGRTSKSDSLKLPGYPDQSFVPENYFQLYEASVTPIKSYFTIKHNVTKPDLIKFINFDKRQIPTAYLPCVKLVGQAYKMSFDIPFLL